MKYQNLRFPAAFNDLTMKIIDDCLKKLLLVILGQRVTPGTLSFLACPFQNGRTGLNDRRFVKRIEDRTLFPYAGAGFPAKRLCYQQRLFFNSKNHLTFSI